MSGLISNLPAILILIAIFAVIIYAGFRVGPRFLIRRLAGLVFVLWGVTFVTFILGYVTPGTVVDSLCPKCTAQQLADLNKLYGFEDPWWVQYGRLVSDLLHFNLGYSYTERGLAVWDLLKNAVPLSVQLGVSALVLALVIGIPVGVISGVRAGSRFDTASMSAALLFYALPTFVTIPLFQLAMRLLYLHNLPYLPLFYNGGFVDWVAPVVLLSLLTLAQYARLARTSMLDVLGQDYIRTARAKGLSERVVIIRHAFRNALVPLVTAIGPALAFVVSGAFFTETLFNIPGIGYQSVHSVQAKDMPVLQATVILVAIAVAVMNLVVDIVYGILDPRVKVS